MKQLCIPLLAVVAAIFPAAAAAQSTATLVSVRDGTASQIVMPASGLTLHDLFGRRGLNLDLRSFGGFSLDSGFRPGAGAAASFRLGISREAFADLGIYARGQVGRPVDGGIFFAVGLRL